MPSTAVTMMCMLVTMTYLMQTSETKTVVSIPLPFTSLIKYHTNVARVLAQKGHQVFVTIPTYVLERKYLDTSGFSVIPFDTTPQLEQKTVQVLMGDGSNENVQEKFADFLVISIGIFDTLLKNESFIEAINKTKPDLIVIDNFPSFYVMSIIPHRLGIPFAFLGTMYFPSKLRVPFSLADVPFPIFPYTNRMTFFQRLQNTLLFLSLSFHDPSFPEDAMSTYAPEMEYLSLTDLVHKAAVFLVELDPVMDYPKPTLPNVKLIGGTAPGPAKALPPQFQSFMDSAKEGVVIVTFGSYVLGLPKDISDKVLQVLLQLPMKSVFRSNLTSPDPKKILTAPWIPQNDLLGHPHTKVFVSHCGKNGQYEALYHAVPIVATPLFADQPYNAERARVKGFAEVLNLKTCTAEKMKYTIIKVATEPKYKTAITKSSRLFKELYGAPMETAAYWLDHVMEYGGDYMRSAGQQMPLYQYLLLDVLCFILCVLALTVGLFCMVCKAIYRCACKYKAKTD